MQTRSPFPIRQYTSIWCGECDRAESVDGFFWSDDPDSDTECPPCPRCHGADTQPRGVGRVATAAQPYLHTREHR